MRYFTQSRLHWDRVTMIWSVWDLPEIPSPEAGAIQGTGPRRSPANVH